MRITGSLLLLCVTSAFPSYRTKIPNGMERGDLSVVLELGCILDWLALCTGERVPCPEGAVGCASGFQSSGWFCNGVGHRTCEGGSMPLNAFGKKWKEEGFRWTKALCEADSDGDGQTNGARPSLIFSLEALGRRATGEELGDPCCTWTYPDDPTPYMSAFTPSHPGVGTHKQPQLSPPSCGDKRFETTKKAPKMAAFNPGEEQRTMDWIIRNYTIPPQPTTYVEFQFNFDDDTQPVFHIIWGEAIVDQPKHLHHFVVLGCTQTIAPEVRSKTAAASHLSLHTAYCRIGFAMGRSAFHHARV